MSYKLITVKMQSVYVDTIKGSSIGNGSFIDPLNSLYNAILWIESPSGGNDPSHLLFWKIYLSPGDYDNAGFPGGIISIPNRIQIVGSGEDCRIEGRVTLNNYSGILNLKVNANNCGTDGIVKIVNHYALIEGCLLTATRYSGSALTGINFSSSGNHCNVIGTRVKLYNNVANATEFVGFYNGSQDNYVFNSSVFFSGNSEENENFITKLSYKDTAGGNLIFDTIYMSTKYSEIQNFIIGGGIQIKDSNEIASAGKVGSLRYKYDANNSYVDMCMQTGAATYAWVNIKTNTW